MHTDLALVRESFQSGASAFLVKQCGFDELSLALESAIALVVKIVERHPLTTRGAEINMNVGYAVGFQKISLGSSDYHWILSKSPHLPYDFTRRQFKPRREIMDNGGWLRVGQLLLHKCPSQVSTLNWSHFHS